MIKRVLSGVRPTGHPQLGNYFGALKHWVDLSHEANESLFCIVDQHALTTLEDIQSLRKNTLIMAATYLACGIDPQKSSIFVQSHIPFHTELAWYLSCLTPMGWLSRMTQFKDKGGKNKDTALTGLFTYPVLMAADITLYEASHVPVGEDQKQHVEFARDIVQLFNNKVEKNILLVPEPLIQKHGARIKSLRDGTKKMSKSDVSDYARINLDDADDMIRLKIKKAKTDPDVIKTDVKDFENRPELENLVTILSLLEKTSVENLLSQFDSKNFSDLKNNLADALIGHIGPIREKTKQFLNDEPYILNILQDGKEKAYTIAEQTMKKIKESLYML
jgi:tryptophanyl-tRNA synthetase